MIIAFCSLTPPNAAMNALAVSVHWTNASTNLILAVIGQHMER